MAMTRITEKHLQAIVDRINLEMSRPANPWTVNHDGRNTANIGNYHLSGAYGGVALHEMRTDGGGVRDVFGGHMPKRELADRMHAFLAGMYAEREGR